MPASNSASCLVTGANRGIGLAFARALTARGSRVIATARHPEMARDLARLPLRLERLDLADGESIAGLARALSGEPIDVLINNAAIGAAGPGFAEIVMEDVEEALRVNAVGPAAVTQALLSNLRAGRRRMVVNLSSDLGSISGNESGGWIAYRASKAALNQLTRTVAAELKKDGFICIAMNPGWVQTDMGGPGAPLSPEDSVAAMLSVMDRLTLSDTGRFLDHRGQEVPW
jgi:NAD(P)-dependent dehydrogenase (short-subunit alcohol dehydrogenase family)